MKIEVRPLKPGEEALWLEVDSSTNKILGRPPEAKKLVAEGKTTDPRCLLIALEGSQCVGRLHGLFLDARIYILRRDHESFPEK